MKLTIDFDEYKPWSGAVRTYDRIVDANMLEELESFVEELYFGEDSISETTLNDLLWHDSDYVLGSLGLLDDEDESFYEKRTVRRPMTERRAKHPRKFKENNDFADKYDEFCTFIETMPDEVYDALFASVHDWYKKEYPEDELADNISRETTFNTVLDDIYSRRNVYRNLVHDSLVRERVFKHICDMTGMDYDLIYGGWLGPESIEDKYKAIFDLSESRKRRPRRA